MTLSKFALVIGVLGLIGSSEPGWLAQALARTDPDVDAALVAYDADDWDLALEHLDVANERRGERPEIHYDRGLALLAKAEKDAAREAFQHGTESDLPSVLASSHYQLGNLAMMDEDWETAVTQYIGCLRAQPDHPNAKWNLELALARKREQEKKDEEKKDEEKQDEEKQDEEKKDEEKKDEEKKDEEKKDEEKQDEQKQDEQKQDEQKQDEQKQDEQKQDEQKPAPPKQIDQGDFDAALEQLDRQDEFMLGRPRGRPRPVEKDW